MERRWPKPRGRVRINSHSDLIDSLVMVIVALSPPFPLPTSPLLCWIFTWPHGGGKERLNYRRQMIIINTLDYMHYVCIVYTFAVLTHVEGLNYFAHSCQWMATPSGDSLKHATFTSLSSFSIRRRSSGLQLNSISFPPSFHSFVDTPT